MKLYIYDTLLNERVEVSYVKSLSTNEPLFIHLDNGLRSAILSGANSSRYVISHWDYIDCETVVDLYDVEPRGGTFSLLLSICQLKGGTLRAELSLGKDRSGYRTSFISKRRVALLNLPRR